MAVLAETAGAARSRRILERRRSHRFACGLGTSRHLVIKLLGAPPFASCVAHVRNLSVEGISLISDRPIEEGTELAIDVYRPGRFGHCSLRMRIVYCLTHPEGEYIIGAEFDRELLPQEIHALL
jgi:hypothetical protein